MAATDNEITLIRLAVGDSGAVVWSADEINAVWDDQAELHGETDRRLVRLAVVVEMLDASWADAARLVTYRQNAASESLSDVAKQLKLRYEAAVKKLTTYQESTSSPARIGRLSRKPSRDKEYPNA